MNSRQTDPATGRGLWLVLLLVALLAGLHMLYPLDEDQATFIWGGKALSGGALMYRDFWDMKQPGIYWWYELTGLLFGFDAWGVRWMDLCWALAVAGILWAATRERGAWVAVLAPCLSFGAFYAKAGQFHLSQVEWLIGGPLAVALWILGREAAPGKAPRTAWGYAVVGIMVTAVAAFKMMEALLPLSMLAVAMLHSRMRLGYGWRQLLMQQLVPAMAGMLLSALAIALWMLATGTLGGALWTAFVYPPEALREYSGHPLYRLNWSFSWFRRENVWLAPWALWAVYNGLRHGRRLELLCMAWGLSAVVIIALQLLSYWEYHFDMLFIPLGVLAALGVGDVLERLRLGGRVALRRCAVAALALSVVACMGRPLFAKTERLARALPLTPARVIAFQDELDDRLAVLRGSADVVARLSSPADRVVVLGDQRMYAIVDRRPVLQVNGNTRFLASQLQQAAAFIREAKPPLIYLGKDRDHLILHGGGIYPRVVNELYTPCRDDRLGTWYQLSSRGPC